MTSDEDILFTAECNAKLQQVTSLSREKGSFECHVMDTLQVISASRDSNNKTGTIIMKYSNVKNHQLNNQGQIHGGALATWADVVTSLSIWFISGISSVSVSLHMDYIGAASIGADLYFHTRVDKVGKNLSFCTCQVTTAKNKIIANASHIVARARL